MARDNGQGRYDGRNKYQRENRFEQVNRTGEAPSPSTNLPVPATPTLDLAQAGDWRARRPPEAATYLPSLGQGWRARSQGRRLVQDFHDATAAANAATQLNKAGERLEESRQDLELAHQRRNLIPLKAVQERLHLEQQLVKAVADFDAVKEARELQRIDQARQRALDQDRFEIAQLGLQAERQELAARIAAAEVQLTFAQRVGQQRGEAELYRAEEEALRNQAGAEGERRRLSQERGRRREADDPPDQDSMPAPLARHMATEREVHRNVDEAERRTQQIRDRAVAQGRDLTDAEIVEIDMLEDAASAAEDSIRRGEASDIEV